MSKLKINRGTTFGITVEYKVDGVATSLVGSIVRFTIKDVEYDASVTDITAEVVKNVTTGNALGIANITLDPTDTATITPGKYYYDIKVDTLGDGSVIYKIAEGTISLDGSPTNRLT